MARGGRSRGRSKSARAGARRRSPTRAGARVRPFVAEAPPAAPAVPGPGFAPAAPPAADPPARPRAIVGAAPPRRRREATDDGSADTPENEYRWRSIRDGERDLPSVERDRAIRIVHRLWERDGYVRRACGYFDEYCVGKQGATLTSRIKVPPPEPPEAPPAPKPGMPPAEPPPRAMESSPEEKKRDKHQEILDRVWKNRRTKWTLLQHDLPKFVPLLGEMLFTANTNRTSGETANGYIDPARIDAVIYDPDDGRAMLGVLLKKRATARLPIFLPHVEALERKEIDPESKSVVNEIPEEGNSWRVPGAGPNAGDLEAEIGRPCHYFYDEKIPAAARAVSRFYPTADELSAYDMIHFGIVEGAAVRNAFGWDVTVDHSDPKEVTEQGQKVRDQIGKVGGVVSHNKGVEIKAVNPALTPVDFDKAGAEFRRAIFGKLGFPETWFADASQAGNAATTELAAPTLRMLELVQGLVERVIREMVGYAVRKIAEVEAPDLVDDDRTWEDFDVGLPEIGGRDAGREAEALSKETATLGDAVDRKWIKNRKAAEVWQRIAGKRWDVDLDAEDIPDDVDAPPPDPLASLFGPRIPPPPKGGGPGMGHANGDPAPPGGGAPGRVAESLRRVAARVGGAGHGA